MSASAPPAEWSARFRSLRDTARTAVAQVSQLRAVRERHAELERLLTDLDSQLERVAHAAVITLVGATGAGKSTLLNALAGRPIAREGIDRPTTRDPVIYAPRDADLSTLLEGWAAVSAPRVERYDPAERPWAAAHVFVDAPDLNSVAEYHRDVVSALAERSDVLLVVLHRQSVIEQAPVSFLDTFARRRALLFVLNRADELTTAAQAALLQQVHELAATRWQATDVPVLALSARRAQHAPDAADFTALRDAIQEMLHERGLERVRRQNAVGTAALIGTLFQQVGEQVLPDLEPLSAEVEKGTDELVGRLADESALRWGLRRADLNQLLWAEAAKRWDGPGGWTLRFGGLTSLGLGAGALLARRHPLLAVGAALGGATTEQLQRVAERRQLSEAEGLLPTPHECAGWYADALSGSRMRAARLTGSPHAFAIPAAEVVYTAAIEAIDEAWQSLVHREVPAAAERNWLRFLRWPLDLPVYALAALIVYRVAIGFLNADYVGIDFLVNALLLAGAYLFCVGFVVRRGLGRRVRRLVRDAIARSRLAIERWAHETFTEVRTSADNTRDALTQLTTLEARWLRELEPEREVSTARHRSTTTTSPSELRSA